MTWKKKIFLLTQQITTFDKLQTKLPHSFAADWNQDLIMLHVSMLILSLLAF